MLSLAQSLTLSDFHQMYAIERAYYDPRYITPPQEAFRWYQAYPLSTLAVKEGEMVAGFLNLFPVRQEVFAQILAGTFNDREMELCQLADPFSGTGTLHMFLCCIARRLDYQGQGVGGAALKSGRGGLPYSGPPVRRHRHGQRDRGRPPAFPAVWLCLSTGKRPWFFPLHAALCRLCPAGGRRGLLRLAVRFFVALARFGPFFAATGFAGAGAGGGGAAAKPQRPGEAGAPPGEWAAPTRRPRPRRPQNQRGAQKRPSAVGNQPGAAGNHFCWALRQRQ